MINNHFGLKQVTINFLLSVDFDHIGIDHWVEDMCDDELIEFEENIHNTDEFKDYVKEL